MREDCLQSLITWVTTSITPVICLCQVRHCASHVALMRKRVTLPYRKILSEVPAAASSVMWGGMSSDSNFFSYFFSLDSLTLFFKTGGICLFQDICWQRWNYFSEREERLNVSNKRLSAIWTQHWSWLPRVSRIKLWFDNKKWVSLASWLLGQ